MTVPGDKGKSARRNARLKAALQENLRRRKAQERGRGGAGPAPEPKTADAEDTHENPSR